MEANNAMSEQVAPERISRAVRAYFLAIRAMNPDAIASTFAEDGTTYDPVGSEGVTGRDAIREFFSSIYKNFKSVALNEDSIFVAGDGAAVKWTGRGTSANGKNVNFEGIDVFEVDADGKIRTVRAYWNPAEMIAQL
jgi:steroid delta-isomerase